MEKKNVKEMMAKFPQIWWKIINLEKCKAE